MSNTVNNMKLTEIKGLVVSKPPAKQPFNLGKTSVFLAGSIEMGKAEDWQTTFTKSLGDADILVLNPRRDDWDSSWKQTIDDPQFNEQVTWELTSLEKADHIVMYFDPETQAPISLLELGLFASSGKMMVCCPEGFWRKGNVDIVCKRYHVPMFDTLDDMIDGFKKRVRILK